MIEVEWYEVETIEAIDDMVEHIDGEYGVKLFDAYLNTFSEGDLESWKYTCVGWIDNLVNELEALKREVKAVE